MHRQLTGDSQEICLDSLAGKAQGRLTRQWFHGINLVQKENMLKSYEVLRLVFGDYTRKRMAADLKLSVTFINKWAEPRGNGGSGELNPLDRTATMMEVTGDVRLIDWLCQKNGGHFVRNPPVKGTPGAELMPTKNKVVRDISLLLAAVIAGGEGKLMTMTETCGLRALLERLISEMEWYLTRYENGRLGRCRGCPWGHQSPALPLN